MNIGRRLEVILRTFVLVLFVEARFLTGYKALRPRPSTAIRGGDEAREVELAREVLRWSGMWYRRLPFRSTCLRRASVTTLALRSYGIDADLVLGAAIREGELDAHAWVLLSHCRVEIEPGNGYEILKNV